ncbi:NAD(P)H-dependent flavin oxidoreductase [Candidatus Enterococcus courvalinii]|uniref:Probable nitronate monooxygenase n=1 Tax=Candidatus Enterococcus courvalinii TaxID=2815329 RepID=A0ABS3HZZ8_9ENTE|nr:nitronate monooxygenase [Enterococcus sp. MSG2901]MBO0481111.1 nitronate monooxygenase [Enterococcus sp. MSG2901]
MITNLFNLDYPIIQGAMANISNATLVAAVSEQGALGTLSSYGLTAKELQSEIWKVRKKTNKNFSCNLMLQQENISELLPVILHENVPIVSISAGFKPKLIQELKSRNVKVISVVGSRYQAEKVIANEVDCIVAEGKEAGGHIGEASLNQLIADIVTMTNIPVVAAGGIGSSEEIKNKLQLGVKGVQLGTAFMVSQESPLPRAIKTLLTNKISKTKVVHNISGEIRIAKTDNYFVPCGMGIKRINQISSVAEIIAMLNKH